MLAPLVIDLLYVCTLMLAFGWAYDILHARAHYSQRNGHLAAGIPLARINRKCNGADGKTIHA
jgi:hypothetical protein